MKPLNKISILIFLLFFSAEEYCESSPNQEHNYSLLQFKNEFPIYCKEIGENGVFDGSTTYDYFYPNKTLKETYSRLRSFSLRKDFFIENLKFLTNLEYDVNNGANVSYKWKNENSLKITVEYGAEITTYNLHANDYGTKLIMIIETGY